MKTIPTLTHITDVGAPQGNGCDSTNRIRQQYQRLGVPHPEIISAGQSPLHVAFAACTDISWEARERALDVRNKLATLDDGFFQKLFRRIGGPEKPHELLPVACNSAPRNDESLKENSKDGPIYRIRYPDRSRDNLADFLVYGKEVVSWILAFRGRTWACVEKIKEIDLDTPELKRSRETKLYLQRAGRFINNDDKYGDPRVDLSNGSQFRSAEHLPIVHYLEALGKLDKFRAIIEPVDINTLPDPSPSVHSYNGLIVPPDEYDNGRIIRRCGFVPNEHLWLPALTKETVVTRESLTRVVPGELSIWPSSNYLPAYSNTDCRQKFEVLNIGTRWKKGETRVTDDKILELLEELSANVGFEVEFESDSQTKLHV